jgi:16S rRNA (cytosine1402-N4)-methyltransferase
MLAPGNRFVDATFGGGGHTTAILNAYSNCYVFGIDRDPEAVKRAEELADKYKGRFDFIHARFSKLKELLQHKDKFDGVLFDFGTSSFQLENPERGFSFLKEGVLDMRMDHDGISARDVVNGFSENDLANIIWLYGEEPKSRKIAAEIVKARKISVINTTTQLRKIILKTYPISFITKKYSKLDMATKTFQALRIFVNDELSEIDAALRQVLDILTPNGKVITISFHALEDRIVKNWAKDNKECIKLMCQNGFMRPQKEEIIENPRARSAILRGFMYTNFSEEKKRKKC